MVKSRLALHLGKERAAEIYRVIAETVMANVTSRTTENDYDAILCYSPETAEQAFKEWFLQHHLFSPQQGSDLGARMSNAFSHAFAAGYTKALLIGSDCPDISRDSITQSFDMLKAKHIVLGPAYDGGYYLIGVREPIPELFSNIEWGTEKVLSQTIDKINAAGLSLGLLPVLRDIDRVEDLQYYNLDL